MEYFHTVSYALYILDKIGKNYSWRTRNLQQPVQDYLIPSRLQKWSTLESACQTMQIYTKSASENVTAETLSGKPSLDNNF